jgi:hypothetical protein
MQKKKIASTFLVGATIAGLSVAVVLCTQVLIQPTGIISSLGNIAVDTVSTREAGAQALPAQYCSTPLTTIVQQCQTECLNKPDSITQLPGVDLRAINGIIKNSCATGCSRMYVLTYNQCKNKILIE